ncbi:Sir2 family NAD-dependent protein deacetylase [bacterium]|nr:Sir2 family NAD-dependent protein deacetylase [bacterium]
MNNRRLPSLTPEQCGSRILDAKCIVAFTGAGISTAAGIPDFRGPNGLYTTGKYNADKVFEIDYFHKHPEMFYEFSRDFIQILKKIQPTITHRFLARLESEDLLTGVITQNIDTLHHRAGSINIAEVHGSYWSASCLSCNQFIKNGATLDWWEEQMTQSPRSPVVLCPHCGGIIKPDVVFFGEPVRDLDKAETMIKSCDLLLVLGSSLTVYPAALLPQLTSASTIVVNQGDVMISFRQDMYFILSDLDAFFKKVIDFIDS